MIAGTIVGAAGASAFGQQTAGGVATFENLTLDPESAWNGDDKGEEWYGDLGFYQRFVSGDYGFANYYIPDYYSWFGFAYTNYTATTFTNYTDQYYSCVGHGYDNSANYCIAYPDGTMWGVDPTVSLEVGAKVVPGFYITNTAWVVNAITVGDNMTPGAFGKGDYFKLIIHALDAEGNESAQRSFYLADYRSDNEADWYYIKDWEYVDLSRLGEASAFKFTFESTRNNAYGSTTPMYFCIDNFGDTGVEKNREESTTAVDDIISDYDAPAEYYHINGVKADAGNLAPGLYIKVAGNKTEKIVVK